MTRIMLLYTRGWLYQTTRSTQITVGPKSVLTLYCVQKVLCSRISVQGKWLVLSCPLFGGFTGLEHNIGCQILGGLCPPNLNNYWGGWSPPPQPPYQLGAKVDCRGVLIREQGRGWP